MAATRIRADGVRRREALLDAALRCFTEQGLLGTGIEEIRRQAGASPSSVYHHFQGLDGLTSALLVRTFERSLGHMTARVLATSTAQDAVRALVDAYLEWALGHPEEARFMYQAMALELGGARRQALLAAKADLQAPIFEHLARFTAAGQLPDWHPRALSAVLLGPSHEAFRHYLSGADPDPAWIRNTLPDLAWRAVRPT